jgi:hypothetical protein
MPLVGKDLRSFLMDRLDLIVASQDPGQVKHIKKCVKMHDKLIDALEGILLNHKTNGAFRGEVILCKHWENKIESILNSK